MQLKSLVKKWRKYSELSNLGIIVRRKFFNNAFDGALTCAGIVSGSFIIFLSNLSDPTQSLSSAIIIITGFSTAIAIGISGLWGAFLSEEAERKKKMIDLKKDMVIFEEEKKDKTNNIETNGLNDNEKVMLEEQEIQKAMITPINLANSKNKKSIKENQKKKKSKNNNSIIEQSERFATIVASLVDGGAPVLGSVLPLIPFFFGDTLSIFHFLLSYGVLIAILIYLGIFLGKISGGGYAKYAINLVAAGVVTLLVSLLLQLVIPT